MSARFKVGRNAACPCGSGQKYKYCCDGKKDWSEIISLGRSEQVRHLTTRGKNLVFLGELAAALKFDSLEPKSRADIKKAFTPSAVQQIYGTVADLWPDKQDLERTLAGEKNKTTGLYVGTYEPEVIFRGVTRHCIYSDTILLVDPFLHPLRLRPEYNPLVHPEEHRVSAIIAANIWFSLAPWIEAGIVKFIRVPGDFDANLMHESYETQDARLKKHPEIQQLLDKQADEYAKKEKDFRWYYILSFPDEKLVADFKSFWPEATKEEIALFLKMIQQRRDDHPYYVEPHFLDGGKRASEFIARTTGANYEMAKHTALLTGSHLITDIPSRWKELELDRTESSIDAKNWSPFAKAFQELEFKFLQNVPLNAALKLRKENRLEDMRGFMRKVWKSCGLDAPFSEEKSANLSAELQERIRDAESEWRKIDSELIRWFGGLGALATPFIAAGGATWIPAAVSTVVGGTAALAHSQHQRTTFERKYPAGFFLDLKKKSGK
ncbi:MAG: SEC-C metal-binding domain-containing protein [Verrucomicrobiota bacterium]|jgi:hypothetical protein